MQEGGTEIRWVHSESMPADGLTKGSGPARSVLAGFLTKGYWRLTHDEEFTSSKKRRALGRTDILDDGVERSPFFPSVEDTDDEDTGYTVTHVPIPDLDDWLVVAATSPCQSCLHDSEVMI